MLRRAAATIAWCLGFALGPAWILLTRRLQRPTAHRLAGEFPRAAACFPADFAQVPVLVVPHIRLPGSSLLGRTTPARRGPAGLCLGDRVLVASDALRTRRDPESLIFHELVHVVQMRRLGLARFCARYARDWVRTGMNYFAIGAEAEAFDLQRRFEAGEDLTIVAEQPDRSR